MTCIVALIKDNIGYIAGDKCASQGNAEKLASNLKVFNNQGVLLGFCGSWRLINVVRHDLDLEELITSSKSVEKFAFLLANKLMELAFEYKLIIKEDDQHSLPDESECLVVYRNKIIRIHSDFSYIVLEDRYASIGMPEHAEGILSTVRANSNAPTLIRKAIKETSKSVSGVSNDLVILTEEQTSEVLEG